jgi:serine/threonine-protein phosphatase 6 regulatory ankyrin repeat subunit B
MNLIDCAFYGNHKQVRAKLQAGDNVNAQRDDGITALFFASQEGHLEIVSALLLHSKVVVNVQQEDGRTALFIASEEGHVEVVRALLQHNTVDVNAKDHEGRSDVVREFLAHEMVDPNVKGALGNTALIWACLRGHVDVVRALLECDRVDANLRNNAGSTALDIARKCQLFEITSCLEEHERRRISTWSRGAFRNS